MKIEKVNEDKIRITLNTEDLQEKNIDLHSFMANSVESQELFLDMLDEAEKEVGFDTEDYKLMIEALAVSNGTFVLTVTRLSPEEPKEKLKRKVNIKRKSPSINKDILIYSFSTFEDFCGFCNSLKEIIICTTKDLSHEMNLYFHDDSYYLVIKNTNLEYKYLKDFYTSIVEFSHLVHNANLFERKLVEYGNLIMKDTAIDICMQHFI